VRRACARVCGTSATSHPCAPVALTQPGTHAHSRDCAAAPHAATLAVGVAAGGLLCMFYVGSYITRAAAALKQLDPQPAGGAGGTQPAKSLAQMIQERKVCGSACGGQLAAPPCLCVCVCVCARA
jgi:hypothetical protein